MAPLLGRRHGGGIPVGAGSWSGTLNQGSPEQTPWDERYVGPDLTWEGFPADPMQPMLGRRHGGPTAGPTWQGMPDDPMQPMLGRRHGGPTAGLTWQGMPDDPMQPLLGRRHSRRMVEMGAAEFTCSYMQMDGWLELHASLREAAGTFFQVYAQPGWAGVLDPRTAVFLAAAPLDAFGSGELNCRLPDLSGLRDFQVEFYAVAVRDWMPGFAGPVQMLFNPQSLERIDFDWATDAGALPAGMEIREQYADHGIHIGAVSKDPAGPNMAILFDSAHPSGGDLDLATPGRGWLNDVRQGMLLIVAEDNVDRDWDGLVDDPKSAARGGEIWFEFSEPLALSEITLIDADPAEEVVLRCYAGDRTAREHRYAGMGNNSSMTIGLNAQPVYRLEVEMNGSCGVAGLSFLTRP
jgi:hypothetical protein